MLSDRHQILPIYDREMYAILFAIKKWHQYLMGRHFIIKTDHQPLKYLLDHKLTNPSQHTWLAKLLAYDYEIQYKQGKGNIVADALSRVYSTNVSLHAISSIASDVMD